LHITFNMGRKISKYDSSTKSGLTKRATSPKNPLAVGWSRQATWNVRSGAVRVSTRFYTHTTLAKFLWPLAHRAPSVPRTESGRQQGHGEWWGDANAASRTGVEARCAWTSPPQSCPSMELCREPPRPAWAHASSADSAGVHVHLSSVASAPSCPSTRAGRTSARRPSPPASQRASASSLCLHPAVSPSLPQAHMYWAKVDGGVKLKFTLKCRCCPLARQHVLL